MRRVAGFTLIELMVTLGVMAVLAVAGLPFASRWMQGSQQMQARYMLWMGVSHARALALRNPGATSGTAVAAKLQLVNGVLEVRGTGSATLMWSARLPSAVSVALADANGGAGTGLSCLGYDNRGQRVTTGGDCKTLPGQSRVTVGLGGQEDLYVDLL